MSEPLLTVEEFAARPDPGYPEELVRGRILALPIPGMQHGLVCATIAWLLGNHTEEHDVGYTVSNNSGVITGRNPDSVRGPDVAYYSQTRFPDGQLPEGYAAAPPDLVVEVLSPHDRWPVVLAKVSEYRNAGVGAVVVVDPERRIVHLYDGDEPVRVMNEADELTLPGPLAGLRIAVERILA